MPQILQASSGKGRARHGAFRPAIGQPHGFLTATHEVVALDAETGMERWRSLTGAPGATTQGQRVVTAGALVVGGDYDVFGFDRMTGVRRWRFTPRVGYGAGIYLGSAVDDVIFAGSPAGFLYAIGASTGLEVWSLAVGTPRGPKVTVFPPATSADIVVAGFTSFEAPLSGGVVAARRSTGKELWRRQFSRSGLVGANWAGGPVFADGAVVVAGGDGTIYGLDATNGSILWSLTRPHPAGESPGERADFRALTQANSLLVASSLSGVVTAYDVRTRREVWGHSSIDDGSASLNVSSEQQSVYVPFSSGRLVSLDAATGNEQWRLGDSGRRFTWPPAICGERIYAAADTAFAAFERARVDASESGSK